MPSEEVPAGTTDPALAAAAAAAPPAWDLEAEASVAVVAAAVGGEGRGLNCGTSKELRMKSRFGNENHYRLLWIVCAVTSVCLWAALSLPAQQTAVTKAPAAIPPASPTRSFDTPQQAADVLIDAADKFDVVALGQIFGPGGEDIVFSGEYRARPAARRQFRC